VLFLTGCNANADEPVVSTEKKIIAAYQKLLSHIGRGDQLFYPDNLTGRILWNEQYVSASEESYQDYTSSWREDEEGGYFIFEPDGKYWASGLPVPYNGLSANGRFPLWLYQMTDNRGYLGKAAKLAQKISAGMRLLSDGTFTMT